MLRRKDEKTSYQTGPDQAGRTEPNIQQQRLLHFSKEHIKNGQTNGRISQRITYTRTDVESYGQTDRQTSEKPLFLLRKGTYTWLVGCLY